MTSITPEQRKTLTQRDYKEIEEDGIDQFALIVAKESEGQQKYMDERFGSLESRMGNLEGRMEAGFRHVNARLDILERLEIRGIRKQIKHLPSRDEYESHEHRLQKIELELNLVSPI